MEICGFTQDEVENDPNVKSLRKGVRLEDQFWKMENTCRNESSEGKRTVEDSH